MHRRTRILTAGVAALGLALTVALSSPPGTAQNRPKPAAPTRVLIVLFDQMVPSYADQFAMPNFRKLRGQGTSFTNAYLGYMASETVIAHNVITSGLEPRHMGWTDEAYRDTDNVFGKGAGVMHITGDLSLADFASIEKNDGVAYPKLADYLHTAYPGTKFITVGEKSYAVESATGATGDIAVRMSSRRTVLDANGIPKPGFCTNLAIPSAPDYLNYREPAGKAVPDYISLPKCGRYYINSDKANDYGTHQSFPAWMYQGEGNRFVPGNDTDHLGGDTWVADAAIDMMENENWSGMFVTMGGIDKAAHMWGAQDDATNAHPDCTTLTGSTHVRCAAENADVQLGNLMAEVKKIDAERGGKTLVVLTADHGATYGAGDHFYGKRTIDAGDSNWYYAPSDLGVFDAGSGASGTSAPDVTTYSNPSDPVKNILDADGRLQFSYQSTAIEAWLRPAFNTADGRKAKAQVMLSMPGVTAAYWKDGDHFVLRGTNPMTNAERPWWKAHGQEIVNTMASDDGPDVIGLLHDRTSYGVYGDHGGAQQSVQRVPMVFWTPGRDSNKTVATFRTPDVLPTILRAMHLTQTTPTDGVARPLG